MSNKIKAGNKKGKKNGDSAQIEAFKEILEYFLAALCIVLCVVEPLYLQPGYGNIGEYKFQAYKWIVSVGLGLISAIGIAYLIMRKKGLKDKYITTDICVLAYILLAVLASLIGGDFVECIKGYFGWYMGLFAQLTFVLLYLFVSRFGRFDKYIKMVLFSSMGLVFLFGVLNRFMIDPLDVYYLGTEYQRTDSEINQYLSTLGQVSWYSTFVATVLPLVLGAYWCAEKLNQKIFTGIVSFIGLMTIISQNSESAFMALAAFVMVFFWFSVSDVHRMRKFWELALLFVASTRVLNIVYMIKPNEIIWFDTFSEFFIYSPVMWVLFIVVAAIWALFYFVFEKKQKYSVKLWTVLRYVALGILVLVLTVCTVIIVLSALDATPDWLAEKTANISYFNWNDDWGNHRGMSWTVNMYVFRELPIINKLFGVGSDNYANYAYINYGDMLREMFPGLTLSNAHNEWMNSLICYGFVGVSAYIGIFVTCIKNCAKCVMKRPEVVGIIACIASYMAHNFFCYQEVFCTPFIFMIMGFGVYIYRQELENNN